MEEKRLSLWARAERLLPAFGVVLFVGALWVLHRQLSEHTVRDVLLAVAAVPAWRVALAGLFTLLSFVALSGYDLLALRYVGHPLSYGRVALATFLGYGLANALGFPLLTGAPVRYRLYTAWGVEGADAARLVAFSTTTFWVGFSALGGLSLLLDPMALPVGGGPVASRALGAFLLLMTGGYLAVAARRTKPLRLGPLALPMPGLGLVVRQIVVGAADWTLAAAVLFVLLPRGHGLSFPAFVGIFLVAQVLGLVSHVPGGLGVFEATVVSLFPERVPEAAVLGSLLAYRAVYYLIPLLLSALTLGVRELRERKAALGRAREAAEAGFSAVAPLALAGAAFVAGVVMLVEGTLPLPPERLAVLAGRVPLPVLEVSHFLASLVGSALLVVAMGLRLRLRSAYVLTLLLLAAGAALSVARGGGVFSATVPLAVLLAVLPARREFYRHSTLMREPLSREWLMAVVLVLATVVWLGLFAYRNVAFSSELWWQFALRGDAPRWLRAMVGTSAVLLLFGVSRLLRPAPPTCPPWSGRRLHLPRWWRWWTPPPGPAATWPWWATRPS